MLLHPESTAYDLFDGNKHEVTALTTRVCKRHNDRWVRSMLAWRHRPRHWGLDLVADGKPTRWTIFRNGRDCGIRSANET
jgi:hypothetical protein